MVISRMICEGTDGCPPRAVIVELVQSAYGSLEGSLLDRVKDVLFKIAESTLADIVVDLSKVHYFGARFVGVLAAAWKKLRERKQRLILCGVTPYCQKLINVLNMQALFEIYPTQAMAISHILPISPSAPQQEQRPLRMGLVTSEVRWDPKYLCLSYFGDGDPLYSEIIPRD